MAEYLNDVGAVHLHSQRVGSGTRWLLVMRTTATCITEHCFLMELKRRDGVVVREASHER